MSMNELNCQKTKIAIIIPVHNRCELTLTCLRRLQTIEKNGFEVTIIVTRKITCCESNINIQTA